MNEYRKGGLLRQREEELADKLKEVLWCADLLQRCVSNSFADTNLRIVDLETKAREARVLAARVDDLRDVAQYGPGGGR